MDYFLRVNKNILMYSIIIKMVIPILGINFVVGLLSNILLLLFLIPLLIILLVFLVFTYYKSKINTCSNCGTISFSSNGTCINCGSALDIVSKDQINKKPSESTIEIKAEEIK